MSSQRFCKPLVVGSNPTAGSQETGWSMDWFGSADSGVDNLCVTIYLFNNEKHPPCSDLNCNRLGFPFSHG